MNIVINDELSNDYQYRYFGVKGGITNSQPKVDSQITSQLIKEFQCIPPTIILTKNLINQFKLNHSYLYMGDTWLAGENSIAIGDSVSQSKTTSNIHIYYYDIPTPQIQPRAEKLFKDLVINMNLYIDPDTDKNYAVEYNTEYISISSTTDDEIPIIYIHFTVFSSISELLHSRNFGSQQIGINDDIHMTQLAQFTLRTKMNIFDPSRSNSFNYNKDLATQTTLGWGLILPNLVIDIDEPILTKPEFIIYKERTRSLKIKSQFSVSTPQDIEFPIGDIKDLIPSDKPTTESSWLYYKDSIPHFHYNINTLEEMIVEYYDQILDDLCGFERHGKYVFDYQRYMKNIFPYSGDDVIDDYLITNEPYPSSFSPEDLSPNLSIIHNDLQVDINNTIKCLMSKNISVPNPNYQKTTPDVIQLETITYADYYGDCYKELTNIPSPSQEQLTRNDEINNKWNEIQYKPYCNIM